MNTSRSGLVFGIAIVAIGILLLLNNLGMASISVGSLISRFWPLILVVWGALSLMGGPEPRGTDASDEEHGTDVRSARSSNVGGWILLVIGLLMLSSTTGWYRFDWGRIWGSIWALIIIAVGWAILRSRNDGGVDGDNGDTRSSGDTHWAVMSGVERKQPGWPLRSGSYTAFMGGADLDLRNADIKDGETYLDLTAVMGGITLIVPDDLAVECEAMALLGGVDFFRQSVGGVVTNHRLSRAGAPQSSKILRIRCRAIMGAVELK